MSHILFECAATQAARAPYAHLISPGCTMLEFSRLRNRAIGRRGRSSGLRQRSLHVPSRRSGPLATFVCRGWGALILSPGPVGSTVRLKSQNLSLDFDFSCGAPSADLGDMSNASLDARPQTVAELTAKCAALKQQVVKLQAASAASAAMTAGVHAPPAPPQPLHSFP